MSIPFRQFTLDQFIEFAVERGAQVVELRPPNEGMARLLNRRYLRHPNGKMPVMIPPDMPGDEVLLMETVRNWCRVLGIEASSPIH